MNINYIGASKIGNILALESVNSNGSETGDSEVHNTITLSNNKRGGRNWKVYSHIVR